MKPVPNSKEALNLDDPLCSLKPLFSYKGVCYREANGRVKPDAIPTAIFPMDPGILPETRLELRAHVILHQWPVDQGPLFKSTSYCCLLDSFSTEITETDSNGPFSLRSSCVGSSLKFTLLLSTFIRGYKDSPGTESYSLVSPKLSTGLQSAE